MILAVAGALPLVAADNVPAIQTANTPTERTFTSLAGAVSNATLGWAFTVGAADITVTDLGFYDSLANGLSNSHEVAIWTAGGALVTWATIPNSTGATLLGSYRYVAVTPVTLSANQAYVIGAHYPTQSGDDIITNSMQTFAVPITVGQSRQTPLNVTGTDPLTFPAVNALGYQGIFGPNFLCSFTELSIDDVTLNEGNAGPTSFQFTVSLSEAAKDTAGVNFSIATADGTAQDDNPASEDNDYVAQSLTAQPGFPRIVHGDSTYTFSVSVNGDVAIEADETFFANVTSVTGAYLTDGEGLGAITNDDVISPEMDVQGNSISIADGDITPDAADNTAFGSTDVASGTVSRSFTLHNTGGSDLTLTGTPKVQIGGAHAADFSVTLQPSSPVPSNNFTIFSIKFDPSALGVRSATVSIDNNDGDENPYTFAIQGTGTCTLTGAPEFDNCMDGTTYLGCNPGTIPGVDPNVTASDNCGAVAVVAIITHEPNARVITYTAINGVGVATCTRVYTWSMTDPTIDTPPAAQAACVGSAVSFSVVSNGPVPAFDYGLTYQWFKDAAPLADGGNVSGATADTLTIDPVAPGEAGSYHVVVSNACGSTPSSAAALTVNVPILTATKTDALVVDVNGNNLVDAGDRLLYTIVITNTSATCVAQAVSFSDLSGDHPIATLVAGSVTANQGIITSGNNVGHTDVVVSVGDLAAGGGNVTISFRVTVDDPSPASEVCNQGTVSGSNFATVRTDDPDVAGAADPTCTPLAADVAVMIALSDVLQSAGVDELVRIPDVATGVGELVGSLGDNFIESEAMAVLTAPGPVKVPGDRIFVVDNDRLVELDPLTGNGTEIGPIGFSDVDGIAFHPLTGVLYGVTYGSNKIIRIDISTGAGTQVASGVILGHRLNDLAFHPDGRAFIITDDFRLYEVNIATGAKLNKWILNGATSMEGLLWSLDGNTLYSAADRAGSKDLVTLALFPNETGVATFVSAEASGFIDLEALAWLSQATSQALFTHRNQPTDTEPVLPTRVLLHQNSPNPFNPTTRITFDLKVAGFVELDIFDARGSHVATLYRGRLEAGPHGYVWNGQSDDRVPASTGVYYYRLVHPEGVETRKMALLK